MIFCGNVPASWRTIPHTSLAHRFSFSSCRRGIQNDHTLLLGSNEKGLVGTNERGRVGPCRTLQHNVSSQLNCIERSQGMTIHKYGRDIQNEVGDLLNHKPGFDMAFECCQQFIRGSTCDKSRMAKRFSLERVARANTRSVPGSRT